MKQLLFCIFLLLLEGCSSNQPPAVSGQIDELPAIYPDYIDVTIPQSIAPLNFAVQTEGKACAVFTTEGYAFTVYASNGAFSIPDTDWEKLLTAAKGKQVEVSVLTEEKGEMECLSSVSYPGFRRPDRSVYRLPPDRSRLPAMERNGNLSTRIILFRSGTDSGKPPDG